jgi:hypothetical protein
MHDTAVGSANFTECVRAPTGEGCRSPATEGGLAKPTQSSATPFTKSSAAGFGGTKPASAESRRNNRVVRGSTAV